MSSDDLENFEAERELQLAQEYQDVAAMFRYAVETERRFYLANDVKLRAVIKDEMGAIKDEFATPRRSEITYDIGDLDLEDLIEEETMVVSISHNGYIKRTPSSVYRAQRRGGKGIRGAEADEDDPVEAPGGLHGRQGRRPAPCAAVPPLSQTSA